MNSGIPTVFNGRQYRSLLEAKWASFFDLLGWNVEYEPFELHGWIPDFLIAGRHREVLCEVKPVRQFSATVAAEMAEAAERGGRNEDLLLLGVNPLESVDGHPRLGWLAQWTGGSWSEFAEAPMGTWIGSESDAKNPARIIGFCHSVQGYTDRVTGCYDGGSWGHPPPPLHQVHGLWAQASNRVQWKRPR